MEPMSDERWEVLRKIPLATKAWYWTHDECVEIAAEMDRLRAEVKALKEERDKWKPNPDFCYEYSQPKITFNP